MVKTSTHITQGHGFESCHVMTPIAGKRVKIFKKRQDEGPNLDDLNNEDSTMGPTNVSEVDEDMEEIDRSQQPKSHSHLLARTGGRAIWWGRMS